MGKRIRHNKIGTSPGRRRLTWIGMAGALVLAVVIGVAVFAGRADDGSLQATASANGNTLPIVDVYKDPTCGCCSKWVEHLQAAGFTVRTTNTGDLSDFKTKHNVPARVRSCHTALVDGYVVEGHVPAADIQRLLKERPANVAGLGVPGMPIGSPGMEVAGTKAQRYDVIAFVKDGSTRVFATHQ